MSQPVQIVPGDPTVTPQTATPQPSKKSRKTLVVVLSVVGVLAALCCIGGIASVLASGAGDKSNPLSLPTQAGTNVAPAPGAATNAPAATAEPTQPAEPTLPPGTVTEQGTLLVGTDIKAGTYRGVGCGYWARLKETDGSFDSIIANGNASDDEYVTVTIGTRDRAFETDCAALMPIAFLRTVPKSNKTSEEFGTLMVGKDIHPGTWRGTATGSCYWARLSGFSGEFDDILANDNVKSGAKFTITVKSSDKGLELQSDCGTLTKA